MGKKKVKAEYNDFLDGEKLRDNTEIRTALQSSPSIDAVGARKEVSPPPTRRDRKGGISKGKKGDQKKPTLTHFVCLPLVNGNSRPQLDNSLANFTEALAKEGQVSVKAIRPVGTLHLTLGVMSLDKDRLEEAKSYLEELDLNGLMRDAIPGKEEELQSEGNKLPQMGLHSTIVTAEDCASVPLFVDLKSLLPMQQAHKTSILYADPVDSTLRLHRFASAIRETFINKDLIVKDNRPLKLHATILNTIYAKPRGRDRREKPNYEDKATTATELSAAEEKNDRSEGHGPNAKSWMRFDASELIEQYKGYTWAQAISIDRVCICKMGAKKVLDEKGEIVDEAYEVVFEKRI
jgi:activating signal cointegrator complex subunit 1